MNAGRDVERLIADWFVEEAVLRAPDRVLEGAGRVVDRTKQRRLGVAWRIPVMSRFAFAGAAVALATIIAVAGLTLNRAGPGPDVGGPSPSPSQPATAPTPSDFIATLTATFTSPLYGYSIAVDPAWNITPATVAADDSASTDDNSFDRIAVTGTDTTMGITAHDLGTQPFDAWLANVHQEVLEDASIPASCKNGEPGTWPAQAVGSEDGVLMTLCNFAQVFVEVDGQAYSLMWANDTFEGADHFDILNFKRALETVAFDARSGADASSRSLGPIEPALPAMTQRTATGPGGVSIGYPSGWTVEDNGVRWWQDGEPDSLAIVSFFVDSSTLEESETAAEWVADRAAEEAAGIGMTCAPGARPTEIAIGSGGTRGLLISNNCRIGGIRNHFLAVLVEGNRGYSFHLDTTKKNGRAWFDALLANVRFDEAPSEDT